MDTSLLKGIIIFFKKIINCKKAQKLNSMKKLYYMSKPKLIAIKQMNNLY